MKSLLEELGQVGAWVASENRPEELVVRASLGKPKDGEVAISIPGQEWFNVIQINAHQSKLTKKLGYCTMKRYSIKDVNGDGINDMALVIDAACLKERYGSVSIRGCSAP